MRFEEKTEEENGGDGWSQIALDRLQVFVDAASGHRFHDRNPDDPADDDSAGGEAADFDQPLPVSVPGGVFRRCRG